MTSTLRVRVIIPSSGHGQEKSYDAYRDSAKQAFEKLRLIFPTVSFELLEGQFSDNDTTPETGRTGIPIVMLDNEIVARGVDISTESVKKILEARGLTAFCEYAN